MQQRSKEWFAMRKGRVTGSTVSRILGKEGLKATIGAIENYAEEKAIEIVYGLDEEDTFESADMKRGTELEPLAFRKFSELMILKFVTVKECTFFPFGKDAGASPDGIVSDDECLEIKCPRPKKFFNLVRVGIPAIDSEYMAQMQFEMLCSNSKRCHFFNYIIYNGKEMWHHLIIERDEVFIDFIKTRVKEVVSLRDRFVKEMFAKQQF